MNYELAEATATQEVTAILRMFVGVYVESGYVDPEPDEFGDIPEPEPRTTAFFSAPLIYTAEGYIWDEYEYYDSIQLTATATSSDEVLGLSGKFSTLLTSTRSSQTHIPAYNVTALYSETAVSTTLVLVNDHNAVTAERTASSQVFVKASGSVSTTSTRTSSASAWLSSGIGVTVTAAASVQHFIRSAYSLTATTSSETEYFTTGKVAAPLLISTAYLTSDAYLRSENWVLVTAVAQSYADAMVPGDVSAWLMVPETTSMVTYSSWNFLDMVQAGDTVYAAGPNGLCVVDADDDAGKPINATLAWGYTDFGSDKTKRIDSLWFGYSALAPMRARVEVYQSGTHTYDMPEKPAAQPVNNRIRVGKRLVGRYWHIQVTNTLGGDFTIDSVSADTMSTGRRL